jgi:hypothetical protein
MKRILFMLILAALPLCTQAQDARFVRERPSLPVACYSNREVVEVDNKFYRCRVVGNPGHWDYVGNDILSAKGDLITFGSTYPARLPVGTNGQVLLADSTQADGIKWGDPLSGLDSDLSAIAGLTPSNDDIIQRKAGAWINRTLAQLKSDLALNNVTNTSDANKPVSTAQQTALDLKENIANKDTDGTLAANSDTRYPSQKAVKTYVDAKPTGVTATAMFSDGSDGSITADGTSTVTCLGAPSSNIYTLTKPCYFSSLIVNSAASIKTQGFPLFVAGTLTNNGTIQSNGNDSTSNAGASTITGGYFFGGVAGAIGGTTTGNSQGTNNNSIGGTGGAGGAGASGAGGTGATPTISASVGSQRILTLAMFGKNTSLSPFGAGSGGAGGGGDGTNAGGGGGAGGNNMLIAAKTILNSGTISAKGGNGATQSTGNVGGGGGGGGGVMVLVYNTLTNTGTITVAGGVGGAGVGTGANGSNGSSGTRIDFNNNN